MTEPSPSSPAVRSQILADLRHRLGRDHSDAAAQALVSARLTDHPRNLIPARATVPPPQQVALFVRMAVDVNATVDQIADPVAVPAAVAGFLARHQLPAVLRLAPDAVIAGLDWAALPALGVSTGPGRDADPTTITGALCGIAETGTLLMRSGPDHPTTLNFLPETHIVVLDPARIVGNYEQAWDLLRAGAAGAGGLPRTVNLITGPSRTADIEQQLQLGAHGPRRLHIILVDGLAKAGENKIAP